jgi:hypothetical protein
MSEPGRASGFSVVAIIAAYNEADIIGHVVGDLIAQGVLVYFLDDGSTDGTLSTVEPLMGHGVIGVERLADTMPDRTPGAFEWERILRRKAQLATELDADWFIHHDADEFRESPWPRLSLCEAIRLVDRLGYTAIDSERLDFWPVDDGFRPGDDVRERLTQWSEPASYDRVQVRCWKKTGAAVDLDSTGGHEARFDGRRVFPIRFILRHYPVRGQRHGTQKVFAERRARFLPGEREKGWHVQYDGLADGTSFLRDPARLRQYDGDALRVALALRHRGVVELETALARSRQQQVESAEALDVLAREVAQLRGAIDDAERRAARAGEEAGRLEALLQRSAEDAHRLREAVDAATRHVQDLHDSLSWKVTAPARALHRMLTRR